MLVKCKKLVPDAVIPSYAKEGDACLDLTATDVYLDNEGNMVCEIGLALEIPEGYVGLIFPRSSVSKKMLTLSNSVGVIDAGYRGPIMVKFKPTNYFMTDTTAGKDRYEKGERVAQLMIIPVPFINLVEAEELSDTVRGTGGFGSTGL